MQMRSFLTNRYAQLLLSITGLLVVWLVVLPWLATIDPMASHIRQMDESNVNVGAMVYTELNWQPPDGAAFR